jgi:SAM-dependent methyltransferase
MYAETIPYWKYREPFLPAFFARAAKKLALTGNETLIDLACGTGDVAFGFSPYVGQLVGVDIERAQVEAARAEAERRGLDIRLVESAVEEVPDDVGRFDLVTIGRAHMWLRADATVDRLDRILAPGGRIFICFAGTLAEGSPWYPAYRRVRRRWAPGYPFHRLSQSPEEFLRLSHFRPVSTVRLVAIRRVSIDHLINRAFSYDATSTDAIGAGRDRFVSDLRAALQPHARATTVQERFQNRGVIFERRA